MKYKIVCEINFPQFECTFDMNIPYNKTVYYVCQMIDNLIKETIYAEYKPTGYAQLINKNTGKVYDMNALISETDIKNGSRLTYY